MLNRQYVVLDEAIACSTRFLPIARILSLRSSANNSVLATFSPEPAAGRKLSPDP